MKWKTRSLLGKAFRRGVCCQTFSRYWRYFAKYLVSTVYIHGYRNKDDKILSFLGSRGHICVLPQTEITLFKNIFKRIYALFFFSRDFTMCVYGFCSFLPRELWSRGTVGLYAVVACLRLCLTQGGVLLKWLNVRSIMQTTPQRMRTLVFCCQYTQYMWLLP